MRIVKCFDEKQKQEIVRLRASGVPQVQVAKDLNVSVDTIRRIEKEMRSKQIAPAKTTVADALAQLQQKAKIADAVSKGRAVIAKADTAIAHLDNVIATQTVPAVVHVQPHIVQPSVSVKPSEIKNKAPIKPALVWTMGNTFINIIEAGTAYSADATHPNFEAARAAIFADEIEKALGLINVKRGIDKYCQGKIRIENEELFYGDLKMDTGLTKRIIAAMGDGKEFKFLVNFLENLMLNPSRRAVHELFGFLEHNDIELTDDGYFLAWKRVNNNYTDMYTGTMDNSLGKVVKVDRNQVDEDSNKTCSAGLHVAAKSYLPHYGGGRGVIIQCKVHPRDVVAIPGDYKNAKLRCCRYEVMKDVTAGFSHY